jgi:hypothetical protein
VHPSHSSLRPRLRRYEYAFGPSRLGPKYGNDRFQVYQQYRLGKDASSPFRGVDRIKLILAIFRQPRTDDPPGCGFDLQRLHHAGCIMSHYPLHDYKALTLLKRKWLTPSSRPWHQPYELIKNYLGEKNALYFVWLGHYTHWLMYASLFGVVTWFYAILQVRSKTT